MRAGSSRLGFAVAGGKPPEDWSKRQLEMREAKAEAASVHIAQLVADKNCETPLNPSGLLTAESADR